MAIVPKMPGALSSSTGVLIVQRTIIVLIAIAFAAAGWFFVSPLFIDVEVDESFNFVLDDGRVDVGAVIAMPEDEQRRMMNDIMDAAASAPDSTMSEPMPAAPQLIRQGRFVDADIVHKGAGQASLYALPDGSNLVRFEDFRTTNGPALVVYLAQHESPASAADVLDGGFINIGKLKGNVGNQNYVVPANVDIADYNSVVIWCELFGVLFSPAALGPPLG